MQADFSLDYDVLTVEHPQKVYLMARFEAGAGSNDALRRPLNISLVIDRSGSMAGDKIDYTRQAAQFLVQHLGPQDTFSIVLYNDQVETLLAPERVSNKDAIAQLIERIRVRGTTNLSGGWLEGCMHVANHIATTTLNRVILMSDGLANRGVTDQNMLITMAKKKYNEGIATTTMGLGKEFNEDLMMEMAHAGGGAFYFIESPEVAPEIFNEELTGLLSVIGQNLMITLVTDGDVTALRQLNAYPVEVNGRQTSFRLGDIFAHEVKTLVLELAIPALETIGEAQIATLRFDYDEITGDSTQHHTLEYPVKVNVRADADQALPNQSVAQSVLLLQAANARRDAVQAADRGDYKGASSVLRDAARIIEESQVLNEELREEQSALLEQAEQMDQGAKAYDDYSRKTMSTQSFYTMTDRHDDTMMLRKRESSRKQGKENRVTSVYDTKSPTQTGEALEKQDGVPPTFLAYKGTFYPLDKPVIRIGRSSHNEIVLDVKGVSRFHGQIRVEDGRVLFEDLGSTNGSTVDDKPITTAYELSVGDVIYLCDEKLVFHQDKV
ncbi:MAG: FHA domain-containing protein [Anaerolineae bacterium]